MPKTSFADADTAIQNLEDRGKLVQWLQSKGYSLLDSTALVRLPGRVAALTSTRITCGDDTALEMVNGWAVEMRIERRKVSGA